MSATAAAAAPGVRLRRFGPLLQILRSYRLRLTATVVCGIVDHVLALAAAAVGAYIVGIAATGASSGELWPWLIALGLLVVPRAATGWLESWLAHDLAFRCLVEMRVQCYAAFERLTPGFMLKRRAGDVGATVLTDVEQLELFFAHTLGPLIVAVIVPLGSLAALVAIHPVVAAVLILPLIAVATVPAWWRRRAAVQGRALRGRLGDLNADAVDSVQGLREVAVFGQEEHQLGRLSRSTGLLARAHRDHARRSGAERALTDALMAIGLVAVLAVAAALVADGELSRQLFPVAVVLAAYAFAPLVSLGETLHELGAVVAAGERILAFLGEPVPVTDRADASRPQHVEPSIRFDGVTFRYEDHLPEAVRGVSFEAMAGQTVALVGHSGSGKSTCAQLLLRWWDPSDGCILIGGHDIADLPLVELPRLVAFVTQDTYLFNCSVRENLRMARPESSDAEIEAAARAALAHDFITTELVDSYDTVVGERGARLSGGQRQRIAIARALLSDAPILVLDEAVSNLDAESEVALETAMARARSGRTSVVIAHRRSTVRATDKVVLLHAGEVVDIGSDAELLGRCVAYRQLMATDAGGSSRVSGA
ncbi:MAG: ATP-binding cassette, subfamily bacterial CydC [Solirubrobacteraceae bacterium]|jgi:ABC-type multidrug transport system fused ATPase/permease subunit|nr:ATP-binding cassette, subfamily bacterial CydC [Solirubrobacteraceae bacterium]